jgi:deazaflavin-dependent oxidoreductase (nitroreductase family)
MLRHAGDRNGDEVSASEVRGRVVVNLVEPYGCGRDLRNVHIMSAKDHPNNAPGVPMVFPPAFERLQIKYMNPLVKRFSRIMPGLATIRHRGRKSGKTYETVVTPFRKGNVLAVALGHGKTDWVKNVLAANEADVVFGSRTVHIVNPRIVPAGGSADGLPYMARVQARKMGVLVADIA